CDHRALLSFPTRRSSDLKKLMQAGLVVGRVVASRKTAALEGARLLLIQPTTWEREPKGDPLVAVDTVGSGAGEFVFWVAAREARSEEHTSELQSRVDLVC